MPAMEAEDVVHLLRDVDAWTIRAGYAVDHQDGKDAPVYAQLALARAISGLALAIVMHAEQSQR